MKINEKDFINEVFDMANPKTPERITLQDLVKCGSGGTIVSLLVDVHSFMQAQIKE